MAKVINKTKGFGSIPRDLVYDKELSDRARFLYVYMACKPEEWEFYQDNMAEELGYEKRTLRKYLDELICMGWIIEEEQQNGGSFGALQYTIETKKKHGENLPYRKKCDIQKMRIAKNDNQRNIDNISSKQSLSDKKEIENKKRECNKLPSQKKADSPTRFVKPTIEQISDYIKEKGYHFDAEQFFYFYESKGWVVGKNSPMRDWHAACSTWEAKRKSQEKKEEPTEETACVMDPKEWLGIVVWLQENAYKIHSKIDSKMFCEMKAMAGDSKLLAEIIIEIGELAEYNSVDVMTEFRRILKERKP